MIEGDADHSVQLRTVYSISDWLGEVGGFASIMHLIFGILFSYLRTWSVEKFLINQLFRKQTVLNKIKASADNLDILK